MKTFSPTEFLYVVQVTAAIESIANDNTVYSEFFQKMFIYPASDQDTGRLIANANPIYVGKSGAGVEGAPTSLTAKGSIARVDKVAHGIQEGWPVALFGCVPAAYNGLFRAINVLPNSFEFQLNADPGGPATNPGIYARIAFTPDKLDVGDLPIKYELPLGLKMRVSDVIVSGTAGDGVFIQFW